jgi:tetratricopeptide (TPR) repeat protein
MDLYFRGAAYRNKAPTPENLASAKCFFEKALTLEPENVEALVGLAHVDAISAGSFVTDDRAGRFAAAETTLIKALSLAPDHPQAHMLLGFIQISTNRATQGIAECERALALDRNLAGAHAWIGIAKVYMGRSSETEAHIHEALRLSPRDTSAFRWMNFVGVGKAQLDADAEAIIWMRRSLELNRNYAVGHFNLAAALARLGQIDHARIEAQAGMALDPHFTIRRFRSYLPSDNPIFLAGRERVYSGMRTAGVPEG